MPLRSRCTRRSGSSERHPTFAKALFVAVLLFVAVVQCSTDRVSGPDAVASVSVEPTFADIWFAGDTVRFVATGLTEAGAPVRDVRFTWTTSDPSVAQVNQTGRVTAGRAGSAAVTATAPGGAFGMAGLSIGFRVVVAPGTATMVVGDTARLAATAWATVGAGRPPSGSFTWATSDPTVAQVSPSGLVTAIGAGSATLTATALGGVSGSAAVSVFGFRVVVSPNTATMLVGDTARLVATALAAASDTLPGVTFSWASSDSGVAQVSPAGLVSANRAGSAKITATAPGGAPGSASVGVSNLQVVLAPRWAGLRAVGDTVRIVATAYGPRGPVPGVTFTWASSPPGVAQVDQAGLVTAMGVGRATITATEPRGAVGTASAAVLADAVVVPDGVSLSGVGSSATLRVVDGRTQEPLAGAITWSSLNPAVATVDGTGVVTAVAAGQATIAATTSAAAVYALVTVSVPEAAPVARWTPMPSDTGLRLYNVWGTSATNVYAAGGGLLHFDGSTWSRDASAGEGLTDVWGASPTDLFAVRGQTWHYFTDTFTRIYVGRWHGSGWAWDQVGGAGPVFKVFTLWGASPNDVFVANPGLIVGIGILEFDGLGGWGLVSCPVLLLSLCGPPGPNDIWGTSATSVYAVGAGGIQNRGRSSWTPMASGTTRGLTGVWGTSATDVFAVGDAGTVLHYDGSSWSPMVSGTTATLRGVWGASPTNVYAVGDAGTILHYEGSTWTPMTSGTTANLYGIWGTTPTTAFVVGSEATFPFRGVILRGTP
jgi:uncharacterized protein YjdB